MVAYIINQDASTDFSAIRADTSISGVDVEVWPSEDATLPDGIDLAILIVRQASTQLEEARAIAVVAAGIRIICLYVEEISSPSDLSQKYCSARAVMGGASLAEAIQGNDQIQEKSDGTPADRNPQKPHNCR